MGGAAAEGGEAETSPRGARVTDWRGVVVALGLLALSVAYFFIWGSEGHYPDIAVGGALLAAVALVLACCDQLRKVAKAKPSDRSDPNGG